MSSTFKKRFKNIAFCCFRGLPYIEIIVIKTLDKFKF
jgi:hypothetical protein